MFTSLIVGSIAVTCVLASCQKTEVISIAEPVTVVQPQNGEGSLEVYVKFRSMWGEYVSLADVNLAYSYDSLLNGDYLRTSRTNADGKAVFENLKAGKTYAVYARFQNGSDVYEGFDTKAATITKDSRRSINVVVE